MAENHWRTFGENLWRTVGENHWRSLGEILWRIIGRKLTEAVLNPHTLEEEPQARAKRTSYVAALGGPDTIGELLWQEAVRRGWQTAFDHEVVADAAAWIWNLVADYFYDM